ncbi:nucleotide sugar dehydrogenase [Halospeciosus flavus]|uniref:nucleotide sugar dehydrogenase n=1 Tax=Halospeciosus flavus TaxID=3032283 RepID=UPI00361DD12C
MTADRPAALYGSDAPEDVQRTALTDGSVPVAVYGLGKLGLPVATVYAERTGNVVGVDVDPSVVSQVNGGDSPVAREPGLDEALAEQVARGRLRATTDASEAASAAALHVVVVPTPLADGGDSDGGPDSDTDPKPDLSHLDAVTEAIGDGLDPGDAVFVECTVPPGTCAERVRPRLAAESGLNPTQFGVAACPERVSSGRALDDVRGTHPRVVGGADDESTRVARLVYDTLVDSEVHPVADAATAAASKVFEGVYRDVNIALANELASQTADLGIDVREAIAAANTQPYCDLHDPGPGVGGHCIPWYPHFLMDRVEGTPLLSTARAVNDGMPDYTAERLREALAEEGVSLDGAEVLVLGLTYRADVAETRATPARPLVDALNAAGAAVVATDPFVAADEREAETFAAPVVPPADATSRDPDAVVVVTPHREFESLDWSAFDDPVVFDGRDALDDGTPHPTYTLGRGWE